MSSDDTLDTIPRTLPWFWHWLDGQGTIAWRDGVTLAFREELEAIFQRLPRGDFAPVDAVLLIVAATRESWSEPPARAGLLSGLVVATCGEGQLPLFTGVCLQLDRVHDVARKVRDRGAIAAEVVLMALEQAKTSGTRRSGLAAEDSPLELAQWLAPPHRDQHGPTLSRTLSWLRSHLPAVTQEALRLRLSSGLEELPARVELELPRALAVRRLWQQVSQDEELGGPARLARNILALLHFPRTVSHADDTPLGGVSDLAPRGTLDRLLLSELAHDDLTLAVRIALGEALYLRRESPPLPPPRRRQVLLDIGVRMWGIPRVFAAAVGMALAAATDPNLDVSLYTSSPEGVCEATVQHQAGLGELLGRLSTQAHLGAALAALMQLPGSDHDDTERDLVLVTCHDAWLDVDFQRQLARCAPREYFVVLVERDGQLTVRRHTTAGHNVLRQARLDVNAILTPTRTSRPALLNDEREAVLPAIFQADPFPLFLCQQVNPWQSWAIKGRGVFTLAKDGRLLHWTNTQQGARQVATGLVPGAILAAKEIAATGHLYLMTGALSPRGVRFIELDSHDQMIAQRPIDCSPLGTLDGIEIHNDVLLAIDQTRTAAISLTSGRLLGVGAAGTYRRRMGRFFQHHDALKKSGHAWAACAWNGEEVSLLPLPEADGSPKPAIAVFSVEGSEQPIYLFGDGMLHVEGQRISLLPEPAWGNLLEIEAVSRDGHRLLLCDAGRQRRWVQTWRPTLTAETTQQAALNSLEMDNLGRVARPLQVWTQSRAIAWVDGRLIITNRRDRPHDLSPTQFTLAASVRLVPHAARRAWQPVEHPRLGGIGLFRHVFQDGSTIYFDSRGLLHFRGSNPTIPEFTTVAAPNYHSAGWCADGRVWGSSYFVGLMEAGPGANPRAILGSLAPIEEIRRELFEPFLSQLR